ncbi:MULTISPECIES: heme-copper oxidase subunit III [unclassified Pseudoclavibacter]|uniref:aa3-type cytochrome oxidase subunit III n=1 Tax=unclassified Pseudoclavibacter TaxID=2615177 RepID=UPI001301682A|nr:MULTISPECIES: heme-copper oxidase subunit III [unclassified Pseudoclavibacter]KAB1646313.1 heme-copper oxidase subunit III [Pseudoclavibacter sp. CFCC 14310]KAB1658336.1 heme-copper oxidase subunit III [Pseudoclavibacter sp. CFCC 11306]KAB1661754.1 heme-copper oxidase subunit III [Pseudoclavibacter sp. CFCC 13796]KAB1663525.1 heme-copper oxidase subunit III [Pseudoclavibacter sp. CFCC 13611]
MSSTALTNKSAQASVNRPSATAVGTIVWLASEVMFFAAIFAVYFTLWTTSTGQWQDGIAVLNIPFAAVNTVILVLSSVTCQFGVFAAERLQPRKTGKGIKNWGVAEWFFLSFALGAIFVTGQVFEYATLYHEGVAMSTDTFWSAFFVGTGFHALHVIGGLIAFLVIIGRTYASRKFGHREAQSAIVVSYYWHFVDVVWLILFTAVYILPLIG